MTSAYGREPSHDAVVPILDGAGPPDAMPSRALNAQGIAGARRSLRIIGSPLILEALIPEIQVAPHHSTFRGNTQR